MYYHHHCHLKVEIQCEHHMIVVARSLYYKHEVAMDCHSLIVFYHCFYF